MDLLLVILVIVLVIAFSAFIVIQQNKFKNLSQISQKAVQGQLDMGEQEKLLKKEAMISAKEALQIEREKLNEELRERRQEISRLEGKLVKREDMLEDKIQEATDKEFGLQKKLDELLEKEDYLAEIVQGQKSTML